MKRSEFVAYIAMTLTELIAFLESALANATTGSKQLKIMAEILSKSFNVTCEEVAILLYNPQKEILQFIWPTKLTTAGFIPATSQNSIAVKTMLERKEFIDNDFSQTSHTTVFEVVRLIAESKPQPIQKIIGVPIPHDGRVIGVIQISRKGETHDLAGDDFTLHQLAALERIATCVAPYLLAHLPA